VVYELELIFSTVVTVFHQTNGWCMYGGS